MPCDDLERGMDWDSGKWEGSPRGRDICIRIADSLHCAADTNKTDLDVCIFMT